MTPLLNEPPRRQERQEEEEEYKRGCRAGFGIISFPIASELYRFPMNGLHLRAGL